MKRRENTDLVPSNKEIYRRIADELDFCKRLVLDITENPSNYCLGENDPDLYNMSAEFVADIDKMIVYLVGRSASENDPTIQPPSVNDQAAAIERLIGASGESKTNIWRRLREKAEFFIFGGESISAKLSALAEYSEYGMTVISSLENIWFESSTGKSVSEGIALLGQGFSAAARRFSE